MADQNYKGIEGLEYPENGTALFQQDFQVEQDGIGNEIIDRESDFFLFGIVEGFEVTPSETTGCIDISKGIARDNVGRRIYKSALTAFSVPDGETVHIVCRHTWIDNEYIPDGSSETKIKRMHEISISYISDAQQPNDQEQTLAQVTRSGVDITVVDERTMSSLNINQINHNNGVFVEGERIANYRTTLLELSFNGISKQTHAGDYSGNFRGIAYGNGLFVAVGLSGEIQTSRNGITWTQTQQSANDLFSEDFYDVIFAKNVFVAVGSLGSIQTSPDGETWTKQTPAGSYSEEFRGIAYGNGLFVAVGLSGEIQTSPDSETWTRQTPADSYSGNLLCIAYGNGLFVIAEVSGNLQTSPDGITWTQQTPADSYAGYFLGIAYGNGLFVAVGLYSEIQTSPDGETWTQQTPADDFSFSSIIFADKLFVAAGVSGNIQTSPDGKTWSRRFSAESDISEFLGIAYANGVYILVGSGGAIQMTSPISLP